MEQNYCRHCGQPDTTGECVHSPNAFNPQDPLTAAAVIERLNLEMYEAQQAVENLETKLERKEEYVQDLLAQLREKQARVELLHSRAYDDDGFAFYDRVELLKNSVSEKSDALVQMTINRDTWKSEAKAKDVQITAYKQDLEELQGKYDIRGRVLDETRTTVRNLRSEINKLTDDLLAAHEEYDKSQAKITELQETLLRQDRCILELRDNPPVVLDSEYLSTLSQLREQVAGLDRMVVNWKTTAANRRSQVLDLKELLREKDIVIDEMRAAAAKDRERLKAVRNAVGHD